MYPMPLIRESPKILAQVRTAMARLNGHLHHINPATESDQWACGQAREEGGLRVSKES